MSEEINESDCDNDTRTACRYGVDCYQKNPAHHQKFKHPPKKQSPDVDKLKTKTPEANSEDNRTPNTGKRGKTGGTDTASNTPNSSKKRITDKASADSKTPDAGNKRNTLANWLKMPPQKKQKKEASEEKDDDESESKNSGSTDTPTVKDELCALAKDETETEEAERNEESSDAEARPSGAGRPKTPPVDEHVFSVPKEKKATSSVSFLPLKVDARKKIKMFFLVDMPDDFYSFWSFCEYLLTLKLAKSSASDVLESVGLQLVGPFDVLAERFNDNIVYSPEVLLRHWRYYYDPPEFQTVIKGNDVSGYHLGYFRDTPQDKPVFVASNLAEKSYVIKPIAENLFGAVNSYLEDTKLKANPFTKLKVIKLQDSLAKFAKKEGFSLSTSTEAMRKREGKVVTRLFHKAGLVVPYDKKTDVGYRDLAESDPTIKYILTRIQNSKSKEECREHLSQLQPIITYANIANDECDFGTSLELGLDLFSFGCPVLHRSAKLLMATAYGLLGRPQFAQIIEAHLEDRRKGSELSIIK